MSKLEIVKTVIASWKQKDVDAVLDLVSDDIAFFYAIGREPVRGKEEMRALLGRLKDHQQDLDWRIKNSAATDNLVMIEGVDEYTNPAGIKIQTPHMTVFEFDGDKIIGWRDYFDFGQLMALEQGEAPSEHVQALIQA